MKKQPAINNTSKNNTSKQELDHIPGQLDHTPGELPRASMDALINSMKELVWENAGLEISVERENWVAPVTGYRRTMLVVTLPASSTPEQRAETDYWINEIAPLYRYAD